MTKKKTFSDATRYAEQIVKNREKFGDEVVNLAERFLELRDKFAANA